MLTKLRLFAGTIKRELRVYQLLLKHERTPRAAKFLLRAAIGYLLVPFDIIPDFIPVLGQIDELIVISILVYTALKLIPKEVVREIRERVRNVLS